MQLNHFLYVAGVKRIEVVRFLQTYTTKPVVCHMLIHLKHLGVQCFHAVKEADWAEFM